MAPDFRKEEPRRTAISTAALAHVDDSQNLEEENDRISSASRDFDRPPLEDDSLPSSSALNAAHALNESVAKTGYRGASTEIEVARPSTSSDTAEDATPLVPDHESKDLLGRWESLQVGFIDEPRHAVEEADSLVAGTMKRLAEIFAEERARLEGQWDRGDNVSTEDLRIAMRRYRSFFRRLLAV